MITMLIDDMRSFVDDREAIVCRTVNDAVEAMYDIITGSEEGHAAIDELWLDHDLGFNGGNIFEIIELLEADAQSTTPMLAVHKIYVHTANPVGRERMLTALLGAGYDAYAINADWEGILHG